jgi:hypothetical protein
MIGVVKFSDRLDLIGRLQSSSTKSRASVSGIVSPWSSGELEKFVWADLFGLEVVPITRKEAMSIPAVSAGRNRIVQLADRPLHALDADDADVTGKHPWLYRTDTTETPWERLAHTYDDWIFYGWSLWILARGATPTGAQHGPVQDARHCPYDRWGINDSGDVEVDGQLLPPSQCLLLRGPFDGLLNVAAESIRAGKALERAWASRVRNPTPTVIVEEKNEGDFTKKEAQRYVKDISTALQNPDGAVFFAPAKANIRLEGASGIDVLTEARNAIRIDIANYLNLNASALDGAKPQSTLTYETQETESTELNDRMTFWTAPLEHTLSMDEVVPRGTRIRFDFATTTPAQTGTPTED